MRIDLTREEHQALIQLLSQPKAIKYRSDLYNTEPFDSMEDKVFDAKPTVGDF